MKKILIFLILAAISKAAWLGTFDVDDYIVLSSTTAQFTTGAAFTSAPTYTVYEAAAGSISTTEIITATALSADFDTETGFHVATFQLTAIAGFNAGNSYVILLKATVDSVVANSSHTFRLRAAPVAVASAQATGDVYDLLTNDGDIAINSLLIDDDTGDAVTIISNGGNGRGIVITANGSGDGMDINTPGGVGIDVNGGGNGVEITGTSGVGLNITGGTFDINSDIQGSLSGSVGSVTGNVDGLVSGTVAGVTPSVAGDAMNLAADAIKAVSYDETTAFPLTAVNGSTLTEAGGTGDQLTAINLPNQTMDITGSLSGTVGTVNAFAADSITAAALNTDFITEMFGTTTGTLSAGAPPNNPSFTQVYLYLYYELVFGKHEQTAILDTVFNHTDTPAYDRVIGDAAGTTTKAQVGAVP